MNDLIVLQATQGLARYAIDHIEGARDRGVVLGYDHRAVEGMSSKRFAQLAANVFRREGFKVYAFQGLVHTPMVVSHCAARASSLSSYDPIRLSAFCHIEAQRGTRFDDHSVS